MRPFYVYDLPSVFAAQIRIAETESSRCYEPVIGIVTDNKDPQKLGRVKVKIPVLNKDETTWWCPIIMYGAGKNRGWFFIPEKDDEVLVMFEHGDLDYPLIVGAFWNGKDKPPDKNDNKKNPRRMIKSRSGSKITFDDDKNTVTIEDGKGVGKIHIDSEKNKITIEAMQGDVCFQSPEGDTVIFAKEMEMKATDNIEVHAGANMSWGSGGKTDLGGGSSMTMSGSKENHNCGTAQMPQAPQPDPKDVADPYGS
jgi:uncharacterized protein involved in type VI secretion and phage assembly